MRVPNFVHLHGHSAFSLLDGLTRIPDIVEKAAVLGMPAVTVTDHGVMYGCADLFFECMEYIDMSAKDFADFNKARVENGKKPFLSRPMPIMGFEAYYASGMRYPPGAGNTVSKRNYHIVLLARDDVGWHNLSIMHYYAFKDGFYRKPRIDMTLLKQHIEGVTVLAACIGGYPQQQLLEWKATGDDAFYFRAIKHIKTLQEITDNHYYLEVQDTGVLRTEKSGVYIDKPQRWLAEQFQEIGEEHDISVVLTNDFHFLNEDDKHAHMAACRIGSYTMEDGSLYDQNWMKSAPEMLKLYPDNPEWMDNTVKVAEECKLVDIRTEGQAMPLCELPERFETEEDYLRHLVWEGYETRYPEGHERRKEAKTRIDYELAMICKMGFSGYFLIVYDIYQKAYAWNIACGLGRGSAAGCCVSYCLGITGLEPLEYGLLFERFLNPGRATQILVDFKEQSYDSFLQEIDK